MITQSYRDVECPLSDTAPDINKNDGSLSLNTKYKIKYRKEERL